MTPEERERIKEEEKAHLRQLRALKQQYREAQRKAGLLGALEGMVRPDLDDVHDEMVDKLTRQNIESEARFEVAMENAGLEDASGETALERAAREEAEREALRKTEADELVRQFKLEMGGGEPSTAPETSARTADDSVPTGAKSIGRASSPDAPESPPSESTTPQAPTGSKSIGRPRSSE